VVLRMRPMRDIVYLRWCASGFIVFNTGFRPQICSV
jgi:hypothetical protein